MEDAKAKFILEAQDRTQNALKSVERRFARLEKSVGSLKTAFAGLGAAYLAERGVSAVIEKTVIQEKATAKLKNAIKQTGDQVGLTVKQLNAFANQMQRQTTLGNEQVQGLETQLLAFGNITGDQFKRTIKVIADFAEVTGRSASTAVRTLGVAINDPVNGLSRLRQAGIDLTKQQQDQIKTLAKSGDMIGAQRALLDQLEKSYGGAAHAAANTFGGALEQLGNAFGDLLEAKKGVPGATHAIQALTQQLQSPETKQAFQDITSEVMHGVAALAKFAVQVDHVISGLDILVTRKTPFKYENQIQALIHQRDRLKLNEQGVLTGMPLQGPDVPVPGQPSAAVEKQIADLNRRIAALKKKQLAAMTAPPKRLQESAPSGSGDAHKSQFLPLGPLHGGSGAHGHGSSGSGSHTASSRETQIKSIVIGLKSEAATYGMTSDQIKIYHLQQLGATKATIAAAKAALQSVDAKKAAAAASKKQESAEKALTQQLDKQRQADQTQAKAILDQLNPNRAHARKISQAQSQVAHLMKVHLLTQKQAQAYVDLVKHGKSAMNQLDQFTVQAARNMQNAFSQFFFDAMNGHFDNLLQSFGNTIKQMVAQAAAAQLGNKLFGQGFASGKSSNMGGWLKQGMSILSHVFHEGGNVGMPAPLRGVSPLAFAGAQRFHNGGSVLGLKPGEVPAILQTGEQVLSRRQVQQGAGRAVIVNNHFTIHTPNGQISRATQSQMAAQAGAAVDSALRRNR